jgi:hypothetical protein
MDSRGVLFGHRESAGQWPLGTVRVLNGRNSEHDGYRQACAWCSLVIGKHFTVSKMSLEHWGVEKGSSYVKNTTRLVVMSKNRFRSK